MDIQHLVDRLEDLIDEGRHLFGTKYTMVDEERALEIIDQMRISIPEEIEKAARVLAQRDRILAEAHEEAARIVQEHRKKAEHMLDQDATVHAAQARAENIKEQARQEASRITAEADDYVMHILSNLEQQLVRDLGEIRNGLTVLQGQKPYNNLTAESQAQYADSQAVELPQTIDEEELVDAFDSEFTNNNQG
ncbi:MAG: ATP synthase F0 subunit B [Anaerolineae bacterium]